MNSVKEKAEVLLEAIPFIKKYQGEIVVIKFGGNAMINEDVKNAVIQDAVLLQSVGVQVVISHGGGPAINDLLKRLNVQSEFVNGLRVTSSEVIEAAEMVLAGKVSADLVKRVSKFGGLAVGLSGVSGDIYKCVKRAGDVDYGYVGDIVSVNPDAVFALLENGFIPIISPIGSDDDGNSYNINGDTAAGELASALGAEKLILLTDIEGLCNDIKVKDVISYLNIEDVPKLKEIGTIAGGMIPKVDCCVSAIENGVNQVHIMDGRQAHSVLYEAFVEEGGFGTIVGEEKDSVGIKWK